MDVRGPGESPLAWVTRSVGDVAELAVVVLGLAAEQVEGFAGGGVVASDQDGEGLVDDAARVEGLLELAHQGGVFAARSVSVAGRGARAQVQSVSVFMAAAGSVSTNLSAPE